MTEPGPEGEDLEMILRAGLRVPDHGKLAPWRFIVIRGDAREKFGQVLKEAFLKQEPVADAERVDFERLRLLRAPVVIAVISEARPHAKIPEWEQVLSCGAACQNMIVAGSAMGYAAQWLTEWYAYDPDVSAALGLQGGERVAGFLYFGTPLEQPTERARPDLADKVRDWNG